MKTLFVIFTGVIILLASCEEDMKSKTNPVGGHTVEEPKQTFYGRSQPKHDPEYIYDRAGYSINEDFYWSCLEKPIDFHCKANFCLKID